MLLYIIKRFTVKCSETFLNNSEKNRIFFFNFKTHIIINPCHTNSGLLYYAAYYLHLYVNKYVLCMWVKVTKGTHTHTCMCIQTCVHEYVHLHTTSSLTVYIFIRIFGVTSYYSNIFITMQR